MMKSKYGEVITGRVVSNIWLEEHEARIDRLEKIAKLESNMGNKHKHYDCIVAWAEGKQIEVLQDSGEWVGIETPYWHPDNKYRIKKEPVIEVKYFYKSYEGHYMLKVSEANWDLKITYQDGKAIKAEVAV